MIVNVCRLGELCSKLAIPGRSHLLIFLFSVRYLHAEVGEDRPFTSDIDRTLRGKKKKKKKGTQKVSWWLNKMSWGYSILNRSLTNTIIQ